MVRDLLPGRAHRVSWRPVSASAQETCWTLIRGAAAGDAGEREEFTRRYLPVVRSYFAARIGDARRASEVDDAIQEVFLACFRRGGALEQVDPARGFRAFLYGIARNVARDLERKRRRLHQNVPTTDVDPDDLPDRETALSAVFDREYASSIMRQAAETMSERARGDDAMRRRVELLRLRFEEGMHIREIASLWAADSAELHQEYAKAAREFKSALRQVVGLAERSAPDRLEAECTRLLAMLG